jgi:AraC family transcriptional regulator
VEDASSFKPFVRGPSLRLLSSERLGWKNIVVERHLIEPGEKPASAIPHHIVALASGSSVSYGERPNRGGYPVPYSKPPGTLYTFVEGSVPALHTRTETDLTVCTIDRTFVSQVAREVADGSVVDPRQRIGFSDESTASLIRLLEAEVRSDGFYGSLYVDHLLYALTSRILMVKSQEDRPTSRNALPLPRLRRVVERMQANLSTDLDLKLLAAESGYSRNHFLRMFRTATGFTPHQYLIRLRVMKAQALIRDRSARLIDVALACGFSNHAHLSRIFRQIIGATPSEYRRSIL